MISSPGIHGTVVLNFQWIQFLFIFFYFQCILYKTSSNQNCSNVFFKIPAIFHRHLFQSMWRSTIHLSCYVTFPLIVTSACDVFCCTEVVKYSGGTSWSPGLTDKKILSTSFMLVLQIVQSELCIYWIWHFNWM